MSLAAEERTSNGTPHRSLRGRLVTGEPNPVDVHVGERLRRRRTVLGLSQEEVAQAVGLTFQQVQKYECGANRIGASRLWDLSRVLGCPISFFFDEMNQGIDELSPRNLNGAQVGDFHTDDPINNREVLELVRSYSRIKSHRVRRQICDLAKTLSVTTDDEDDDRHDAIAAPPHPAH